MPLFRSLTLVTFGMGAFLFYSLHAQTEGEFADPSTRKSAFNLIQPFTHPLKVSGNPLDPSHQQLLVTKVTQWQNDFSDDTIEKLMGFGYRYTQNTWILNEDDDNPGPPSLPQTLAVLDIFARLESPPSKNQLNSLFCLSMLIKHANECSFSDQCYYLALFHELFKKARSCFTWGDFMVEWSLAFMRPHHSEGQCTHIAALVSTYIANQLDEEDFLTPTTQIFSNAYDAQFDWEDDEVSLKLDHYLNNGASSGDECLILSEYEDEEDQKEA